MTTASPREDFVSIQCLRGFAALIVVFFHASSVEMLAPWGRFGEVGSWGVDIFFVISGFIMWVATNGKRVEPRAFFLRRLWRIYPLYWIILTLWIVTRLAVPGRMANADIDLRAVTLSYALIPHMHGVLPGRVWPILPVGWTLQLELFFYGVFAIALLVRSHAMRFWLVVGTLGALSLIGLATAQSAPVLMTYTNPLLLEFAAGMALGANVGRLMTLKPPIAGLLIALGLCGAAIGDALAMPEHYRPLLFGAPAVLLVVGGLGFEERLRRAPNLIARAIGDASFSLYLTHPLVVPVTLAVWQRLGLPVGDQLGALAFIPAAIVASLCVALPCYHLLERPLVRAFPGRKPRRSDGALAPAAPF